MTDRELLEMASKAAWHTHLRYCKTHMAMVPEPEGEEALPFSVWNPLTDDGDALRLAVALDISLLGDYPQNIVVVAFDARRITEKHDGDRLAATRRAIVRAAAAIGSAM